MSAISEKCAILDFSDEEQCLTYVLAPSGLRRLSKKHIVNNLVLVEKNQGKQTSLCPKVIPGFQTLFA
jgi:hypothetical protein